MSWIEFTILGKVPAKSSLQRVGVTKKGKAFMYTAQSAKQYANNFGKQLLPKHKILGTWEGGLVVQLIVYHPHRNQDTDSFAKCLLDLCQEYEVIKNDRQVDELYVRRFVDKKNPRAEIKIWRTDTR